MTKDKSVLDNPVVFYPNKLRSFEPYLCLDIVYSTNNFHGQALCSADTISGMYVSFITLEMEVKQS